MLTLNPLLGRVMAFDRHALKLPLARAAGELGFIKGSAGKFDMTVDLRQHRPSLIGFLSGARYRLDTPGKKGFKGKRLLYTHCPHLTQTFTRSWDLRLVEEFGIAANGLAVDIHVREGRHFVEAPLRAAALKKGPYAHIHPASRWLFKLDGRRHGLCD